jgi:hypothetical protein
MDFYSSNNIKEVKEDIFKHFEKSGSALRKAVSIPVGFNRAQQPWDKNLT